MKTDWTGMETIELENQINQAYSGFVLKKIYDLYFASYFQAHSDTLRTFDLKKQTFDRVAIPKNQVIRLIAVVLSDTKLLGDWIARLPEPVVKLLEALTWYGQQELEAMERQLSCSVATTDSRGQIRLRDAFCLFIYTPFKSFWGAEGNTGFLDIPLVVRRSMKPILSEPDPLSNRSNNISVNIAAGFEDNGDVFRVLPLIRQFISHGELQKTKKNEPQTKSLTRLKEICRLREFYNDNRYSDLGTLRTRMLVDFCLSESDKKISDDSTVPMEDLVRSYLSLKRFPHPWFLSHIKGLYHCRDRFNHRLHVNGFEMLKYLPANRWITAEQIKEAALVKSISLFPVDRQSADRYLYVTGEWQGWGNKKKYLTPRYYDNLLALPSLKAILFMFAAIGLLDLALRPFEASVDATLFDGLEAVRLNETGEHLVQGKSLPIQAPKKETVAFELDTDRLLIRTIGSERIGEMELQRFSERLAPHRFRVTAASMLQDCSDKAVLIKKVESFITLVNGELPENWQRFFNQLVEQSALLKQVEDVHVFRILTESREHLNAIAGDKILRNIILKSEGKHILVRSENLTKFKKRLEELGFLL